MIIPQLAQIALRCSKCTKGIQRVYPELRVKIAEHLKPRIQGTGNLPWASLTRCAPNGSLLRRALPCLRPWGFVALIHWTLAEFSLFVARICF